MTKIIKQIRSDDDLRESFQALCREVYGFDFEAWFEQGYWTDAYQPYAIVEDGKIVSSASVNHMTIKTGETVYRMIQIGTVMTHPMYRNRGYAKAIMLEILKDTQDQVDGIYLFANESVLEFYPKFGFEAREEKTYVLNQGQSMDLQWKQVHELSIQKLEFYYKLGNPYARTQSVDNFSLFAFYQLMGLNACVYYHDTWDLYMIYDAADHCVIEILGKNQVEWARVVKSLPDARLGFLPKDRSNLIQENIQFDDTQCFIYQGSAQIFEKIELFPLLSHA